jgi:hypothetical protein
MVGAPCLIGGFWEPVAAAYLWIALGATGSLVVIAFGVRAGARRSPVLTFVVGAAIVATMWLALYSTVRDRSRPQPSPIGGTSECLLTGYSTAGDTTLSDRKFGVRAQLDSACPRCRHRTGRWAEAGQAFGWFALRLCSPDFPAETRVVAHLGGANDDFLIAHGPVETLVFAFLVCVRVGMAPPDPLRMVDALAAASSRQLATMETHAHDIGTVMGCARARGVRFFYFHDFLAMDLDGQRSAARQQLLEARQKATEANGGTFVDLLATFSDRAGVHWFNDFIHLSAVGHQQVATLMCTTMSPIDLAPNSSEEPLRGG